MKVDIDQGDRSLISYFERGREFGVRATSEVSHGDRFCFNIQIKKKKNRTY
jgi:hypothetical protein